MEHLAKAERLYKEGRYEEVLTVCEEALRLSHNPDPRLYDQRAAALERLAERAHQVAKQYGHGGVRGKVSAVSGETDPSQMSLMDLAEQCVKDSSDDRYILEIIRRAVVLLDDDAWTILQQVWTKNVRLWFHRHPRREAALRHDSEQNYIDGTFQRFWQAVSVQQLTFASSASALSYLHACLNALLLDMLRASSRSKEESLLGYGQPKDDEPVVEDHYQENELWEVIKAFLPDKKEQRVAYLLYHANLKPREIVRYCPGEFSGEDEIYRLKRNIMQRLLRNADKIRWHLSAE